MEKVEFMEFYNFSRRVMKITIGFCHHSNAFRGTLIPNQSSTQKIKIPRKMMILLIFHRNVTIFNKMEGLGDFSTFRAPLLKTLQISMRN